MSFSLTSVGPDISSVLGLCLCFWLISGVSHTFMPWCWSILATYHLLLSSVVFILDGSTLWAVVELRLTSPPLPVVFFGYFWNCNGWVSRSLGTCSLSLSLYSVLFMVLLSSTCGNVGGYAAKFLRRWGFIVTMPLFVEYPLFNESSTSLLLSSGVGTTLLLVVIIDSLTLSSN